LSVVGVKVVFRKREMRVLRAVMYIMCNRRAFRTHLRLTELHRLHLDAYNLRRLAADIGKYSLYQRECFKPCTSVLISVSYFLETYVILTTQKLAQKFSPSINFDFLRLKNLRPILSLAHKFPWRSIHVANNNNDDDVIEFHRVAVALSV